MSGAVAIDGRTLRIVDVVRVARERASVELTPEAHERIVAAHAVVERYARSDTPIYGLTTGLGHRVGLAVDQDERADYQRRILLGRAVAIGDPLPTEIVRGALLVRASCAAAGGSGLSPAAVDLLLAFLANGIHPVVGDTGSITSADLGLMASLTLPLLGRGTVEAGGERLDAATALARIGRPPLEPSGRDGLALCSSNAVTVATAALALDDALRALDQMLEAAALSLEAFVGNPSPFDERVLAARPADGQDAIGRRLRALLAGSRLLEPGAPRRVQDPISFRCIPAVYGATLGSLERARDAVERETAAAADNPLVVADADLLLSNGNFHSAALALALEGACLGLAQAAWLAVQRVLRLLDGDLTDLPGGLTPVGRDRVGVAVLGLPLLELHSELRHLALPAALDTPAAAEGVEDHAGGALLPARKLARMVPLVARIVAVELAVAAQALDLRGTGVSAPALASAYALTRRHVATVDEDRPLGTEVEALARALGTAASD